MTYIVKTAREFYNYEKDSQAIKDLQDLGFSFDDWGDGYCEISGQLELHVFCVEQIQDLAKRFGEISLTPREIMILNWMSGEDLVPHD